MLDWKLLTWWTCKQLWLSSSISHVTAPLESQNQVLQSFACTVPSSFQWLTSACLECMYLMIVIMIRWSGITESEEINSFSTTSIAPPKLWCHCIIHTWVVFQGTTLQTWIIIDHLFPLHWDYSGPVWQLSIVLLLSTVWYCCVLIASQRDNISFFLSFLLTDYMHPVGIRTVEWMAAYFPWESPLPTLRVMRKIANMLQISSLSLEISASSTSACTESLSIFLLYFQHRKISIPIS